jgi:hypothetical protein
MERSQVQHPACTREVLSSGVSKGASRRSLLPLDTCTTRRYCPAPVPSSTETAPPTLDGSAAPIPPCSVSSTPPPLLATSAPPK